MHYAELGPAAADPIKDCETRGRSGSCSAAGGAVGEIAVEADHAEIDTPIDADHAGVFRDRVIHRVPRTVIDHRSGGAEPARNALRGPRQQRRLLDVFDADDLQP